MSRLSIKLFLIFAIGLSACQPSTPESNTQTTTAAPETQFADFYIRYLQEEGQLRAEATFRKGKSLKESEPMTFSSVFFEGGAMELRDLRNRGIRYKSERSGTYNSNFAFKIQPESGEGEEYELGMSPVDNFTATVPFSKTKGASLSWQGDALQADEQLVAFFVDKDNKAHLFDFKGPIANNSIVLAAEKLAAVPSGQGKLYLVKKRAQKEEKDQKQIKSLIEFYTHTVAVELVN
ncbi:MAG: hypothetical protein AAGG75_02275 [Bacteroidota bacterium]